MIGDVDVTEQLLALYEETGGFGTLLMIAHDWDDKARWLYSDGTTQKRGAVTPANDLTDTNSNDRV